MTPHQMLEPHLDLVLCHSREDWGTAWEGGLNACLNYDPTKGKSLRNWIYLKIDSALRDQWRRDRRPPPVPIAFRPSNDSLTVEDERLIANLMSTPNDRRLAAQALACSGRRGMRHVFPFSQAFISEWCRCERIFDVPNRKRWWLKDPSRQKRGRPRQPT